MSKKPLTKKLFLEKLAIHGADFKRWEDVDATGAEDILKKHKDLKAPYEEALALDNMLAHYNVPNVSGEAIVGDAWARIEKEKVITLEDAKKIKAHRNKGMGYAWGGGIAVAASVILMMFMQPSSQGLDGKSSSVGAGHEVSSLVTHDLSEMAKSESVSRSVVADTNVSQKTFAARAENEVVSADQLFAEWDAALQESLAQKEILELFDVASNEAGVSSDAPSASSSLSSGVPDNLDISNPADVEAFIDEMFQQPQTDKVLEQELDLWELYLQSEG